MAGEVSYSGQGRVTHFDSGEVTLNTDTYTQVGFVRVLDAKALVGLRLTAGGQPVTAIRLTRSAVLGGTLAVASGTDEFAVYDFIFDPAIKHIAVIPPATLMPLPAGGILDMSIDSGGIAELGVEAKSNGGTLRMQGFTVGVEEGG